MTHQGGTAHPTNTRAAYSVQQTCWPGTAGLLGCHSQGPDEEATHTTTIPNDFSSRVGLFFFSPAFATPTHTPPTGRGHLLSTHVAI